MNLPPENLVIQSLVEMASLIRAKQASPVEVMAAHLEQIERLNPDLNALVTLAPDALERARLAEADVMKGDEIGALHGVPLTIKDTIATAGVRTTSGSRLRQNYVPSEDAPAVKRLKAAGAIILGKTNTPEMAIPYETDNPLFGRTSNPYDRRLTCGGSSGGEAAAIAACMSPAGLGSDLSGSIRVPAHFCGIVGLRPTSGQISMQGHFPFPVEGLEFGACLGPMARRVADVSLLFKVLVEKEASSAAPLAESFKGLRVAWYDNDGVSPVSEETRQAIGSATDALKLAGVELIEERPPGVEFGSRLWVDLFSGSSASDVQQVYSGSEHLAGPDVRKILEAMKLRRPASTESFQQALAERNRLHDQLMNWMRATPLIVAPVGAVPAFPHGSQRLNVGGESVSIFRAFSYSQTFNVFDLPSVVVRAGWSAEGLPIGVQIVGPPFGEQMILAAAAIVEENSGGWNGLPDSVPH